MTWAQAALAQQPARLLAPTRALQRLKPKAHCWGGGRKSGNFQHGPCADRAHISAKLRNLFLVHRVCGSAEAFRLSLRRASRPRFMAGFRSGADVRCETSHVSDVPNSDIVDYSNTPSARASIDGSTLTSRDLAVFSDHQIVLGGGCTGRFVGFSPLRCDRGSRPLAGKVDRWQALGRLGV
jgi:hypothetical protein